MIHRSRTLSLVSTLVAVWSLSACGGSSDDATSDVASVATDAPANDAAVAGDPATDPAATTPTPAPADTASAGGATPGGGGLGGTCSVEVTGGVTENFTSGQDIGEAYVTAWIPADQQAMAEEMMPGGTPGFQVACSGDSGQSVLLSLYDIEVPLGSTSVPVPDNSIGFYSSTAIVGNDGPTEVVLTTFDESRLAGSVTFTGEGLGTPTSTVTMTFDFVNPY